LESELFKTQVMVQQDVGGHSYKIMVVDDSTFMRKIISSALKRGGFEVVEGQDGVDAVKLYLKYRPDLVIMDINMPGTNGISALKVIKKIDPTAKVMLLTANYQEWMIDIARRDRACAYLNKPVDPGALCRVVREALNKNGGSRRLIESAPENNNAMLK